MSLAIYINITTFVSQTTHISSFNQRAKPEGRKIGEKKTQESNKKKINIYEKKMKNNFHQFSAKSLQGKEVSMDSFKGKTVMVVNTASKCGLAPQLKGLDALYNKYKDRGLVVLGFPCNQFANQEPGDEKSISEGCVLYYGVTFPMFAKVDVNGPTAHPIYKYLKSELPGFFNSKIKWNFTKFIINGEGKPIKRFSPTTTPEKIEGYLQKILF